MTDDNDLLKTRRAKMAQWRAEGGAYGNQFRRTHVAEDLHSKYAGQDKEALVNNDDEVFVAGRVMLRRVMGKASFITLQDVSGRIQCYLRKEAVANYGQFESLWDIGDIVGVQGTMMRTNKGELTVQVNQCVLLNKTLLPLPEKHHGVADQEIRYRQRYLDLMMNEESAAFFKMRSQVVQRIREFFLTRHYLEVETPMMHNIPGGATARPFITHHNAMDLELYLRVAPELYLKRLVVGGFERVFEINRNFRNEGLSTRHNPEFTMLEFYQAYSDYQDLIELTQELLAVLAKDVLGGVPVKLGDEQVDLAKPATQMTMVESIAHFTQLTPTMLDDADTMAGVLKRMNLAVEDSWGKGKLQMELFEAQVEERLIQPTFITHYPAEVSPLARRNDDDAEVTDRFELFAGGREIANGFSELNDPEDQAERFRAQVAQKDSGDLEAMHFDQDYIRALEYGLPPTAGEGIGIDRLVMLLAGKSSIRDVLLFPLMRPIPNL